ncbi:MAG: PorP/SprF family type IX secretion system membrane protein [Chitinophagaceae bacterium]|nr:PorP/SprF family type IX secretion system membrane protein [Chitinophagaceae bacterium]
MVLKRAILGIILFRCFLANTLAQDVEFSQFFNSPLYLNPAYAGVGEGPRFCMNYRNQWAALNDAYVTYTASYDQNIDALNGGIGVLVATDRQANGLLTATGASGIYSYQLNLSKNFGIKAAAQISFVQKRIDASQLIFAENINPYNGSTTGGISADMPDVTSKGIADIGGGIVFYTRSFYAGLSAKHVTSPNESFISSQVSPWPVRIGANIGIELHSKKGAKTPVYFSPNLLFAQQETFKQLNIGAILGIGLIYGGIYFRSAFGNNDAMIFMTGLRKGIFKFGYSYDATISNLESTGGTHELSVVMNLHDSRKVQFKRNAKKFSDCPEVF